MVIDANDRHLVAMMAATVFATTDVSDTGEAVEIAIELLDTVDLQLGELLKANSARKAVREGK